MKEVYRTLSKHIIALKNEGKSEEEIIHIISNQWEINDRVTILNCIAYAESKSEEMK